MKRSRVSEPGQATLGAFLLEVCVASFALVWNHTVGMDDLGHTLVDIYIGVGVMAWSLIFGVTAWVQRTRYRGVFGVRTGKATLAVRLHGVMLVASLVWLGNADRFLHG